jgi:hypothetical protein
VIRNDVAARAEAVHDALYGEHKDQATVATAPPPPRRPGGAPSGSQGGPPSGSPSGSQSGSTAGSGAGPPAPSS